MGTIEDTEEEAIEKYGKENIQVYTSVFVNMWYSLQDVEPRDRAYTHKVDLLRGRGKWLVYIL